MRLILNLSFGLTLLFLSSTSLAVSGDLRWQSYYDREGVLDDAAVSMAVSGSMVFVAGTTQTTTGGYAFTVRAHNTANGTVLWQDNYDREGTLDDAANGIAVLDNKVFAAGWTQTTVGGYAFSIRTYDATNGTLLWENHYDREGSLDDWANAVAVRGNTVFVAGATQTTTGGYAFSARAYNATDGTLLWENHYDREEALEDTAQSAAVHGSTVYVAGWTQTAAGGYAFSIRTYNATNGTLLWENHYDREGDLNDSANAVAVSGNRVFAAGRTRTNAGGNAFTTRAHKASNGSFLWGDYYDRNTAFSDVALSVVVSGITVYTVGFCSDSPSGYTFSIRAINATNGTVLWQDNYARDGTLDNAASSVAVRGNKVFAAGWTQTTAGGYAFSIRVYNSSAPMTLLWENHYDREGALDDWANCIAVDDTGVFVGGITATSSGGYAFSVRAFEHTETSEEVHESH